MNTSFSFQELGLFNTLIQSYLSKDAKTENLYSLYTELDNFQKQIENQLFDEDKRKVLHKVLLQQNSDLPHNALVINNIEKLKHSNTFTITTGHQLSLFGGSLYFFYKIISTIKLCHLLSEKYTNYSFIPVFWMATEDHDFEEVNHFWIDETHKFTWKTEQTGAVGTFQNENLTDDFQQYLAENHNVKFDDNLKELFNEIYTPQQTFAESTRQFVHHFFGKYGLVILDANQVDLKKYFITLAQQEINQQSVYHNVSQTNIFLKQHQFPQQVNPREINLFYINQGIRERIEYNNQKYEVLHTDISFTKQELLQAITQYPERFSPNVLMRPLYQQTILPNLAYIGGAGEISYWLQLKSTFNAFQLIFPMLVLRDSAVWLSENNLRKWNKLGLNVRNYFDDTMLLTQKLMHQNDEKIDISNRLKQSFYDELQQIILTIDKTEPTQVPVVKALYQKHLNEWEVWEQKWMRLLKKKNADILERMQRLKNEVFPNGILQERKNNFSSIYPILKEKFIPQLLENFNPLEQRLKVFFYLNWSDVQNKNDKD